MCCYGGKYDCSTTLLDAGDNNILYPSAHFNFNHFFITIYIHIFIMINFLLYSVVLNDCSCSVKSASSCHLYLYLMS